MLNCRIGGQHNMSLQLSAKVRLWFVEGPIAGVRFALVIGAAAELIVMLL